MTDPDTTRDADLILDALRRMNMVMVDRKRYADLLGAEAAVARVRDLATDAMAAAVTVNLLDPMDVLSAVSE